LGATTNTFILARYCPDPPVPPENGGLYDWSAKLSGTANYNTKVTYTCDVARRFENLSASDANTTVLYDTQVNHFPSSWVLVNRSSDYTLHETNE